MVASTAAMIAVDLKKAGDDLNRDFVLVARPFTESLPCFNSRDRVKTH